MSVSTTFLDFLDDYTYDYFMLSALDEVDDSLDKREGSVCYDMLAPSCTQHAEQAILLKSVLVQAYIQTATGDYLDLKGAEQGLTREAATAAVKKAYFTNLSGEALSVNIGTLFATQNDSDNLTYKVTAQYTVDGVAVAGTYQLTCTTAGTTGNSYTGDLSPVSSLSNLGSATMSDLISEGTDEETDDAFRERILEDMQNRSFAGNISYYKSKTKAIDGVGGCQVFPVWNGGGTVKLVVCSSSYGVPSEELIENLQETIDPADNQGKGLGLAPIDHIVTVAGVETLTITVTATLTLKSGYTIANVQSAVETALETYLSGLRAEWDTAVDTSNTYGLTVYQAEIIAAIIAVDGIANVTNVTINGAAADLTLSETSTQSQMPILGTVTLNE